MAATRSVRVVISGRVQGVGYRAWTERRVSRLGLSGWVRNRSDGDVEAVFSGPAEAVDAMLAACREGPRGAAVRELEVTDEAGRAAGPFVVRY
jgi:acylphosphatase